jgi:hypothetical protein
VAPGVDASAQLRENLVISVVCVWPDFSGMMDSTGQCGCGNGQTAHHVRAMDKEVHRRTSIQTETVLSFMEKS